MGRQLRRIAGLMLLLFAALFVNLNLIQLVRADDLANHPSNRRLIIQEYQIERGPIVAGENAIARSVSTDDELKYQRVYEDPHLWSHVTGYYSFVLQRAGLEQALNETLTGTPTEILAQNLAQLLGGRDPVGNTVRLTIDPAVQATARQALGDRVGAVVALEPRTGAVLAHYANPDYDPNRLSGHDASVILDAWEELKNDPARPLLDRAVHAVFPPGSTFKLVTAAAALERGWEPDTAFADEGTYSPPQTSNEIRNFSPGPCLDGSTISLRDAVRVSCNTVFARLGVELGDDALIQTAERFGYNREPPYELTPAKSRIPKELDPPATAQSAIGQRDVRSTVLQAAMVAAAIANDGVVMKPHVVAEVRDPSGRLLRRADTGPWREGRFDGRAVSDRTAQLLREMMEVVVSDGTGRNAAIPGVRVGGKTGTAQDEAAESPTVWFVGYAEDAVAVAVALPDAGASATGGGDAAPIARAVMDAIVGPG